MIRTYYYLIGTCFYLDILGGIVFSTSSGPFSIDFSQDFDGSELYYEKSFLLISSDVMGQRYMWIIFPNNPSG